jgi:hypothetical protein
MSMGRSSIFVINGLFMAIFFGVLILCNVLFSNVAVQLFNKSGLAKQAGLVEGGMVLNCL